VRSQIQYRFSFAVDLLATAVITLLEFASIALVFSTFGTLGGWTLGELAFLYGLVEISFGLMDLVFSGFDPPAFGNAVRLGRFDQLLLRPVGITAQVMGSAFSLRRIGKVALGLLIFRLALQTTAIDWTAAKVAYLPLVVFGMVAFFGGLFILGASITFWTVESIEAVNILTYGGQHMISHPMHIYQDWLRRFFTFVVPGHSAFPTVSRMKRSRRVSSFVPPAFIRTFSMRQTSPYAACSPREGTYGVALRGTPTKLLDRRD
jgi:ABC-2 type transport system permease protein